MAPTTSAPTTGTKEAVAFVLDASPSMGKPFPSSQCVGGGDVDSTVALTAEDSISDGASKDMGSTRFSCAKSAIELMVSDLIIQSKASESIVVVINANETRHHLTCEEQILDHSAPFPHVMEINGSAEEGVWGGMMRPTVGILRALRSLQMDRASSCDENGAGNFEGHEGENSSAVDNSVDSPDGKTLRGRYGAANLCDGIIIAADAIHRRTYGKKFNRRLILFTDAATPVKINPDHMAVVIDGLRRLECNVTVIGLDLDVCGDFTHCLQERDEGASIDEEGKTEVNDEKENKCDESGNSTPDGEKSNSDDGSVVSSEDEDEEGYQPSTIKSENEKFLQSFALLTGGTIFAVKTLRQILKAARRRRIPNSTRRKMIFNIAPGLSVDARFSLITSVANVPSLRRTAVIADEDGNAMKNALGEEMTSKVSNLTSYWDVEDSNVEVEALRRTQAYWYGSDLIPMGSYDVEGLKLRNPVSMTILGYASASDIPRSIHLGSPYAVFSEESKRAAAAILALSRAMHELDQAAICTFVKGKDADPILGALFPLPEGRDNEDKDRQENDSPSRLFFIQLPFADDLSRISLPQLNEQIMDESKVRVAEGLVDSLMLPPGSLCSHKIGNPAIRSLNRTVMERAIDPNHGIVKVRGSGRCHKKGTGSTDTLDGTNASGDGVEVKSSGLECDNDPMSTPLHILERAKLFINEFRESFPVAKNTDGDGSGEAPARKRKFWTDLVD